MLPEIYEAALRLPHPAVESTELPDQRVTHDRWKDVFDRLQAAFGAGDLYWTVPCWDNGQDVFAGSLADDLSDIYRDVKEGLELTAWGASKSEVLWQWRFSVWSHWGEHAVEALRVIHARHADAGSSGL